jgi:hypothetical protein
MNKVVDILQIEHGLAHLLATGELVQEMSSFL